MPIAQSQRKYPLALRPANDYPLNAGIVAAYDFQGDPDNAYAQGDGVAHVGASNYTKTGATPYALVEAISGLFGRDPSMGRTTFGAYGNTNIGNMGFGSADGKGNFTIHRRMRTPSVPSANTGIVTWCRHADAAGVKIYLYFREYPADNNVVFYWATAMSAGQSATTPSVFNAVSNRIPYNTVVDVHLVRSGDTIKAYLNGVLVGSSNNPELFTYNTNNTSTTIRNGITTGTSVDILFIDETYWNRDLSESEVAAHTVDTYKGYVNDIAPPSARLTQPAVPDGQSVRFVGTAENADTVTCTLTSDSATIGPEVFAVTNGAFDFTVEGLDSGSYSCAMSASGPGGTSLVSNLNSFTIAGVGGEPEIPEPDLASRVFDFSYGIGNGELVHSNFEFAYAVQTVSLVGMEQTFSYTIQGVTSGRNFVFSYAFEEAGNPTVNFVPSTARTLRALAASGHFEGGPYWNLSDPTRPVGRKDPDAEIDFSIDWSDVLTDIGNDTIGVVTFGLNGVQAVANITIGSVTSLLVRGGVGPASSIMFEIATNSVPPRIEQRTIFLSIGDQ